MNEAFLAKSAQFAHILVRSEAHLCPNFRVLAAKVAKVLVTDRQTDEVL